MNYREIYARLIKSSNPNGQPSEADDMLRENGIDVLGTDFLDTSYPALLVYYAGKVKEFEQRIKSLEDNEKS